MFDILVHETVENVIEENLSESGWHGRFCGGCASRFHLRVSSRALILIKIITSGVQIVRKRSIYVTKWTSPHLI